MNGTINTVKSEAPFPRKTYEKNMVADCADRQAGSAVQHLLHRAAMQSWRLEVHASVLTSAATQKWKVRPPTKAPSSAAQELAVRQQLRELAVM